MRYENIDKEIFADVFNYEELNIGKLDTTLRNAYEEIVNIKNLIQSQKVNYEAFSSYRNFFRDKEIVIVGAGPTAMQHVSIPGAIYIGVNGACLLEHIQCDYLFCQDFYMSEEIREKIVNYRNEQCTKFFGIIPERRMSACKITPEAMHVRRGYKKYFDIAKAVPYYIYDMYQNECAYSIENEPLMADGIIFCAMQFALQCHPKRIYLVGCDCSKGFFYKSTQTFDNSYMIRLWKVIKEYIDELYPNIIVTSINPVGLKGIFEDIYM